MPTKIPSRLLALATAMAVLGAALLLAAHPVSAQTPSNNANLSALSILGTAVPGFNADTTSYTISLDAPERPATIAATAADANATVEYNPADADTETGGHQVVLNEGDNTVTVTVTAEDTTTKDYTVTVTALDAADSAATTAQAAVDDRTSASAVHYLGSIGEAGDVDWIRVELESDQMYRFALKGSYRNSGWTLDVPVIIGLYNDEGGYINGTHAVGSVGHQLTTNARLHYMAEADGDYYVGVRGIEDQTGTYGLRVLEVPDDVQPDNASTPGAIAVDGSQQGVIDYRGDVDWYQVSALESRKEYVVELSARAGWPLRLPTVLVYDSAGDPVRVDYLESLRSRAVFTPSYGGTYYIAALSRFNATGRYTLELARVPAVTVSFGEAAYSAAEGSAVEVIVTLSEDPKRPVTIPISKTNRGGASDADYSVPASVTFEKGETERGFTFSAAPDGVADAGESVALAFGRLPANVSAGTTDTATVSIIDVLSVSFGAAAYSAAEGGTVDVKITLSAAPGESVTIPIDKTDEGGAGSADYSGVPANVTFASTDTERSFTFRGTDDDVDDDGESVTLSFGTLPDRVTEGAPATATVSITDNDVPDVTVSFGAADYSAAEGGTMTVTVSLSAAPERPVTIPIDKTEQGGAGSADYSGVPASVTFASTDTEQSFTFSATDDDVDDDGESVTLSFGTLPDRVTEGAPATATVSITDNDVPDVTVSFGATDYSAAEGGTVTVKLTLSAAPERPVTIPIDKTEQGGAGSADYSGVPASVTFESGETERSFTFTATDDTVADDGESVTLSFGTLPDRVTEGAPATATVSITDNDVPANWSLIPPGLGAGDEFRLLFVTSGRRDALSGDIADYNAFVQSAAGRGHTDIQSHGSLFRALASTGAVDARDNTATAHTADDRGVPIHWLNGPKAADDYADFYDGSWDHRNPIRDEDGGSVTFAFSNNIWTGSGSDGTEYFSGGTSLALGSAFPQVGTPGAGVGYEISSIPNIPNANAPFYGLSGVFRVEGVAAVDNAELSDLRVDGTSVAGFAAATTSYTIGVADTVDQVTIAASTADPDATLAYGVDADPDAGGHQVDLIPGANTVAVTVTAQDKVTIKQYTLTIIAQTQVTAQFSAASYTAAEGGIAATVTVNLDADPDRTVTIPIEATGSGGADSADYSLSVSEVTFESGETERSFTFTATDDTVADDGESVTLSFGTLPDRVTEGTPATATVSITDDDVPADWSLIPTGLGPGDQFRLLFVTSGRRNSRSTDIADYNAFVQEAAGGGHRDIQSRSSSFRALGSTGAVDARDNTATAHTADDRGVPIHWLNGPKAADDYADFYDGSWDHRNPIRDEDGGSVTFGDSDYIWTGSGSDGTEYIDLGGTHWALGSAVPRTGVPGAGVGYEISSIRRGSDVNAPFYGLSGVFRVEGEAAVDNADLSDLRVDGTSVDGFAAATTSYTVGVAETVDQVTIAASTADPDATLAYGATDAEANADGHQVDLNEDANTVIVTVAGRDGVTTKQYTLIVKRVTTVTVSFSAASYTAVEGGTAATVTVNLDADPDRTVTIPIEATGSGGADSADYSLSVSEVTFESGETERSFTFTATDDTVADGGESVTLSFGTLPDRGQRGYAGHGHGEHHRRRRAGGLEPDPHGAGRGGRVPAALRHLRQTGRPIGRHRRLPQLRAERRGRGPHRHPGSQWQLPALASTLTVDARDNTATTHTADDRGVPIHWLNGPKAADDYADFYDGAWDHSNPVRDEHGTEWRLGTARGDHVWTGSNPDGSVRNDNAGTIESEPDYIGNTSPGTGVPGRGAGHELRSGIQGRNQNLHLYGLSGVFRVEGEGAVDNAELSDLRVDGTSVNGFAAATTSYTVSVADTVDRVTIAASTADPDATLAYGVDADPDAAGHQVDFPLSDDQAAATVTVTAQDGNTTRTYTVNFVRPVVVPGAPSISTVTPGDIKLTVAWNAPTETGDTDIIAYDVRHILTSATDKADANWTVVQDGTAGGGTLSEEITGLTNGLEYDVQVRAENSVGNGDWSATMMGTPPTRPTPTGPWSRTPGPRAEAPCPRRSPA